MIDQEPHFSLGHFCGGCALNNKFHTGCFATGDAKEVPAKKEKKKRQPILPEEGGFRSDHAAVANT